MSDTQVWRPFRLSESSAHAALQRLAAKKKDLDVRAEFDADDRRLSTFTHELEGLYVDMSKQRWDKEVLDGLQALAVEADLKGAVADMFSGVKLNTTENRAVLHVALRADRGDDFQVDGSDVMEGVLAVRERMLEFVDGVHDLHKSGHITDVVNIGIGGSDLGPAMAVKALRRFAKGPACHFVSNVDGAHLASVLSGLNPKTTMLVIVSKTFTTQETMANARIAKEWLVQGGGGRPSSWWRCPPIWRERGRLALTTHKRLALKIGWAVVIPCGVLWESALRCPSVRRDSDRFCLEREPWMCTRKMPASKRTFRCCWPCSAIGTKMHWACALMW